MRKLILREPYFVANSSKPLLLLKFTIPSMTDMKTIQYPIILNLIVLVWQKGDKAVLYTILCKLYIMKKYIKHVMRLMQVFIWIPYDSIRNADIIETIPNITNINVKNTLLKLIAKCFLIKKHLPVKYCIINITYPLSNINIFLSLADKQISGQN